MTNVFRSRESTLINCFFILNAFHVEDFLLLGAASDFVADISSGVIALGGGADIVASASMASNAGEAAREEFLLPSNGLLVGVFWGLADNSVN